MNERKSRLPLLHSAPLSDPTADQEQIITLAALTSIRMAAERLVLVANLLGNLTAQNLPENDDQLQAAGFLLAETFSDLAAFFTPASSEVPEQPTCGNSAA